MTVEREEAHIVPLVLFTDGRRLRCGALRDVGASMDTVCYTELAPTRFKTSGGCPPKRDAQQDGNKGCNGWIVASETPHRYRFGSHRNGSGV